MSDCLLHRFVALVCRLREWTDKLDQAATLLENFRADGIVVAEGERLFITGMADLQAGSEAALVALNADTVGAEPRCSLLSQDCLSTMDKIAADWRWALLDEVLARLQQKQTHQETEEKRLAALLKQFGERLAPLPGLLEEARRWNAAVELEKGDVARINRRYERAHNAIRAMLAEAYEAIASLQEETKLEQLALEMRYKTELARRIRKRADLLVLSSPPDARKLQSYEALLRTASEPGVHGISLHATSTLVQQDREQLTAMLESASQQIRAGCLRALPADVWTPVLRKEAGGVIDVPTRDFPAFGAAPGPQVVEEVSLRSTGEFMYRLLLPEPVQRYLEGSSCSLTLTTNDLELPWELMHDGKEHLCIARPTARMPMGTYLPPERRPPPTTEKIRMLLIRPAADLEGAASEIAYLRKELEGPRVIIDELTPETATGRELNHRLLSGQYHIIHFAGHAQFDRHDPDRSGLLMANGELFLAQKARRLLGGRPLVFLNACESGTTPKGTSASGSSGLNYLQTPAGGLASAFVYGGALGCVGAVWPVYDDGASFLAKELYSELLKGAMIGEAMRGARERTRDRFPLQVTWAAFVLYGDPTFQLFA